MGEREKDKDDGDATEIARTGAGKLQKRKVRRNGFTAKKRAIFIEHLSATLNVRASARAAKVSIPTVYRVRRSSPPFRAAWEAALVAAYDELEATTLERLINGEAIEAIKDGVAIVTRKHDTRSAIALLRMHRETVLSLTPVAVATKPIDARKARADIDAMLDGVAARLAGGPAEDGDDER